MYGVEKKGGDGVNRFKRFMWSSKRDSKTVIVNLLYITRWLRMIGGGGDCAWIGYCQLVGITLFYLALDLEILKSGPAYTYENVVFFPSTQVRGRVSLWKRFVFYSAENRRIKTVIFTNNVQLSFGDHMTPGMMTRYGRYVPPRPYPTPLQCL